MGNTTVKDTLREELNNIRETCERASRVFFLGGFKKSPEHKVFWRDNFSDASDYKGFLDSFLNTTSKMLVVHAEVNKVDIDLLLDATTEDEIDKEASKENYETIAKSKNHVVWYKLIFFEDGWCFEFQRSLDWSEEYQRVKEMFNDIKLQREVDGEDFKPISNDVKDEIARKVVADETYLKSRLVDEKMHIVIQIAEKHNINHWSNQQHIYNKAEQIFTSEIKPKLEAELKMKVKELKEKGYSKVRIRGELGITQSVLERLFY